MIPGGALYVPGAERLIPKLIRILDFARKNSVSVLSSADAHGSNDPEFQEFPPHCITGTEGQRKIDATLLPRPFVFENKPADRNLVEIVKKHQQIIVQKQELDVFSNPVTEKLLRILPKHAIVFGVTTEYCVKLAVVGLRRLGIKVAVVVDAVQALEPRTGEAAIEEIRRLGVEFITTETLLGTNAA